MIKFGIPSMETVVDKFPGQAVLTLHSVENSTSKRRFTLSKSAAEQLGVTPGVSKVAFSFEGGNFIAVIPDSKEGIAENVKMLVNKELTFTSKQAHDYMCKKYDLNNDVDNHLEITTVVENYGMKVGSFSTTPLTTEEEINTSVNENDVI